MPAIAVTQLEKVYRGSDTPAVSGLDLSVETGEIVGLLGPNGAGKTTTLSILCGLLRATRGSVRIQDIDVTRHPGRVKPLIGLVPQDVALYPRLTARENLTFFARMHGLRGDVLKQRVGECLSLMGLERDAGRQIAVFSGGMKRRANLAAGLVHKPPILILDEPTVGIDTQSRHMVFENLRELNRAGTTIIYATHYMEEAEHLCARVVIIDEGKVLKEGPPSQLIDEQPGCESLDQVFLELTGRHLRD